MSFVLSSGGVHRQLAKFYLPPTVRLTIMFSGRNRKSAERLTKLHIPALSTVLELAATGIPCASRLDRAASRAELLIS